MKDAGISDGDILIVDRSLEAANNDIVVAVRTPCGEEIRGNKRQKGPPCS